jgi:DMSO/TMAO reductase YedYZ heme-binding membrane subunit
MPLWILKVAVAWLWVLSWLTELDPTRDFPDRYGLWTLTFLATMLLVVLLARGGRR